MDPDVWYKRARYFYENQQAQQGLSDIREAIRIDSMVADFRVLYADLLYATGKVDSAAKEIETAIRIDPKNVNALVKMGELKYYLQDYVAMFKYLDEALMINKNIAKVYFIKGMAFKEQDRKDLAISSFQTTVEQDPDYYHAYIQLGILYGEQGNPLALDYYRNAIEVNPNMVEGYYNMGYFLQQEGRLEDAIRVYNDLLRVHPDNGPALHNIGYIYLFLENNPEAALPWFSKAIQADPEMVNAYFHRGLCYEKLGNKSAAKTDFENALKLAPDFDLAKKKLGKK